MNVEKEDEQFKSKLDEASKKKAKEELHENNDKDRAIAVHTLRKWVSEQDWLKIPTDFAFLLRFLRVKKFSQLEARKCIENYWTGKTNNPLWFKDIDPADVTIQEIFKTGFQFSPKKYDKHGRRVLFVRLSNLGVDNIKGRWGLDNVIKTAFLLNEWLLLDENVQVNGLCIFFDYTDVTVPLMVATMYHGVYPYRYPLCSVVPSLLRHRSLLTQNSRLTTMASPERLALKALTKDMMDARNVRDVQFVSGDNALPLRIKAIHWYNEPTFFDAIYQIIAPFFKQKIKDRMVLHGKSLVKIYDDVGMSVMPDEYLPDDYCGPSAGKTNEIIDEMIADMMKPEFRKYIKELSCGKYGVDKAKRKEDDTPAESFRKLNVE